jgi:hypothetical protein
MLYRVDDYSTITIENPRRDPGIPPVHLVADVTGFGQVKSTD